MKNLTRNWGIDLLRIASMLGVVFLHVLGHGGILNTDHAFLNFSSVWLLEILAYPAVNCFVLISGYVGYKEGHIYPKIKNLISLMFCVIFYSVFIFLVFTFLGIVPFDFKGLAKNLFPAIFGNYWFFSAYLGLFLLSPLLNLLVQKMDLKCSFMFWGVFMLFSIISIVYDTFSMLDGYSLTWFVFMYLTGAIIKKFKLNELFSRKWWLIIALAAFMITWISKIALHFSGISLLENHSSVLVKYVSPTIVFMAIALLCLFSRINCRPAFARTISFFASSAFSVYLIHDHSFIRDYFVSKIHMLFENPNFALLCLNIVFIAVAIFLACIVIDKVRIALFKLIKIDKLAEKIEKLIHAIFHTVYIRIQEALHLTDK